MKNAGVLHQNFGKKSSVDSKIFRKDNYIEKNMNRAEQDSFFTEIYSNTGILKKFCDQNRKNKQIKPLNRQNDEENLTEVLNRQSQELQRRLQQCQNAIIFIIRQFSGYLYHEKKIKGPRTVKYEKNIEKSTIKNQFEENLNKQLIMIQKQYQKDRVSTQKSRNCKTQKKLKQQQKKYMQMLLNQNQNTNQEAIDRRKNVFANKFQSQEIILKKYERNADEYELKPLNYTKKQKENKIYLKRSSQQFISKNYSQTNIVNCKKRLMKIISILERPPSVSYSKTKQK